MAAIKHITITSDHITRPDDYYGLPENNKLKFSVDSNDKVICPISHNELEIGSTCYKVNCCKQVFSNSLKDWISAKNTTCPMCRAELKTIDVFTTWALTKIVLSKVKDPIVINQGLKVTLIGICVLTYYKLYENLIISALKNLYNLHI